MSDKEKRGIYNVSFNEKRATQIQIIKDIESQIKYMLKEAILVYNKGWHNNKTDKGMGSIHIKLHLEKGSNGEITLDELLNMGNFLRNYLEKFKEPFVEEKGARIYEWENDEKIRFRVVIDKMSLVTATHLAGISKDIYQIISFYSDRNLNKPMEFKNPKVKEYYENKLLTDNKSPKSPFFSKMKNTLHKVKEGLNRGKEKINNDESYLDNENLKNLDKDTKDESLKDDENKQDEKLNTQNSNKALRKRK